MSKNIPTIVCICGSTKFKNEYLEANLKLTLEGKIVVTVGGFMHTDNLEINKELKLKLDHLHLRKIDLADEVYIINVKGYIGKSTTNELAYAIFKNKSVKFYDSQLGTNFMSDNSHKMGKIIAAFMNGDEISMYE